MLLRFGARRSPRTEVPVSSCGRGRAISIDSALAAMASSGVVPIRGFLHYHSPGEPVYPADSLTEQLQEGVSIREIPTGRPVPKDA